MNRLAIGFMAVAALAAAGCATEQTRRIARGEDTEVTSGFAEADLNIVVNEAVQGAGYLADSLKTMFEEALMGWDGEGGNFIVYNEDFATQTGSAPVKPEFIMTGKLREQNVRRDNGNFYKENSLMIRLTDVATGLDFWQKRVPLQKAVDKKNVLN